MDWRQVERQLERAFTAAPLEYGTARVIEREEPFELAEWILPAPEPTSYMDVACRHGNVVEALQKVGIEARPLLALYWDGFGPVTHGAGLDLVGTGPQRYLCWWDEDDSYRAIAAIFPWWDSGALSRTVSRAICQAGEGCGLQMFGSLPDETTNWSPHLVAGIFVRGAYLGVMDFWERRCGVAWVRLAQEYFGRIVEPNHLQRCLDQLKLATESTMTSEEEVAARRAESAAIPREARIRLLDDWLRLTYREHREPVASEAGV